MLDPPKKYLAEHVVPNILFFHQVPQINMRAPLKPTRRGPPGSSGGAGNEPGTVQFFGMFYLIYFEDGPLLACLQKIRDL